MDTTSAGSAVSKGTLTPSKRPHVVDLSSVKSQNNFTKTELSSDITSETLSEPDNKRKKKNNKEIMIEEKDLRQMWCNRHFVVSKLDGHNDVVCSLDCNQHLLLTGRLVTL